MLLKRYVTAILNLPKYLDKKTTNTIKLGLREIIINAIEHGNLNIGFEEKTQATTMAIILNLFGQAKRSQL